ncbi:MAG: GntR family transcriptional regulator [Oscillospiraceae bacterium]|nr:GntR family transcriptional regulator [Oscillospiraceae bacterium]
MLEYKSLNDLVYEEIKKRIIENKYKPNQKLDIDQISAELKVSRTPVTNAIKALERNGYVTIIQRSGSYVRSYDKKEIEAMFDFRAALEEVVVCRAINDANRTMIRRYISLFESCLDNLGATSIAEDMRYFDDLQAQFHSYLWKLCPAIIYNEIENVMDLTKQITAKHVSFYIKSGKATEFARNELITHIELAKSILSQNEEEARKYIKKDIIGTKDDILFHFDEIMSLEPEL